MSSSHSVNCAVNGCCKVHLTFEEMSWIATALRSAAKAGKQVAWRRQFLEALAERIDERAPGNPRLRTPELYTLRRGAS